MQELLQKLEINKNWKQQLRGSCKKNRICTSAAEQLTPKKLKTLNEWFTKIQKQKQLLDSWAQHEKGAFTWVLLAFSSIKNVLISDFREQEWLTLYKIFSNKSQNFLRYQTKRFLVEKTSKNKHWDELEEKLLLKLIEQHTEQKAEEKGKWYKIARKLFQMSEQKYFRSAKQCRERWSNYLDPSKVRGEWSSKQELNLVQKVQQKGKKWAELALELKRNEHCVKNKYNSIITHQRKISPSIRKQQKILFEAKKRLQNISIHQVTNQSIIPEIVVQPNPTITKEMLFMSQQPKIKIKFKNSNESLFDDKGSFVNYNDQFQNKNRLDFPYTVEGEHHVLHLLKEDEEPNKNQNYNQNFLWNMNSPQIMTPYGLTPSPIPLNYSIGQINIFHNFMQNWCKTQKAQQFK